MGSINPSIDLRRDGEVAVVTMDNPPVNALKHEVRAGLVEGVRRAAADPAVNAIVIACAGRTFSAGADITEFGKPPLDPMLGEVVKTLEDCEKPIVAALFGTVLGGGFEVALGCHYRVAAPGTKIGLPEVKLGILPGAGGTQRLPRLIGPEKALKAIVSGDPIPTQVALADGAIDAIAEGDLLAFAIGFARGVVGSPIPRTGERDGKLAAAKADPKAFEESAAALAKRARGQNAPIACIEAVRASFTLPLADGLTKERALFSELVRGDQSRAQRHVFFAEREALKVPGMAPGLKGPEIAKAGVIGAGTMGGGIAMNFANAGIPVVIVETSDEALQRGLGIIRRNYENTMKRGGLSQADMEKRIGLITGSTDYAAFSDVDMVIEAAFEEMDLKKEIFSKLDAVCKPGAVLATNTSTLDVDAIAAVTKRPQDVLGMHFFSPANVMKLLEIVRGKATGDAALAAAIAVGKRMGKVPVIVGVCYGFVGNRMLHRRQAEAERLILEGALPHEVDAALTEFGFPMGPFAMSDLAGLDVSWRVRRGRGERAEVADTLAEMGRHGQKTGKGYFIYEPGNRTPVPDPEVEAIVKAASERLGIARRSIGKDEILERLIYPMINEGARILEGGIATRPSDIDVVWVYGYGWPVWRGGPMHYADSVGLAKIRDRLSHYAQASGNADLAPAPLLERLANEGHSFSESGANEKAA